MTPSIDPDDTAKAAAGRAAVELVASGAVIGVGTGSTVNAFIGALAASGRSLAGAVSSSEKTSARLRAIGIEVLPVADVERLQLYVDGADEIDPHGNMTKGGGGALTREKIVASMAERFVCIVDDTKLVPTLGGFPIPVEVVPMAETLVSRRAATLGGVGRIRMAGDEPCVTDNGQHIVDIAGLRIDDPAAFETELSGWPGVVTVGVFAHQRASLAIVGGADGEVRRVEFG